MRILVSVILLSAMMLSACGGGGGESSGGTSAPGLPRLVIEPDDGRSPILEAIAGATNNIRLTIYQITDLQSVAQVPPAPADSIVAALISKAQSSVTVDYDKYYTGSGSLQIQQTVDALRKAGAIVHPSSTAFCVTHQKTFVIDGPTTADPGLAGTAIIMALNLMPDYFGGTRDYAVITRDPGVVLEVSRVFDADFVAVNTGAVCSPRSTAGATFPPPYASDTPSVSEGDLL